MHYQRMKNSGTTEERKSKIKLCSATGCKEQSVLGGLCRKHDMRLRRTGTTEGKVFGKNKRCSADECENYADGAFGLCHNHYMISYRRRRRITDGSE